MRLPFLTNKPEADADGFYATGISPDSVLENEMRLARIGKKEVILTRAGGELVAFSNVCPHAAADLSKGRLARGQIKCPDHGYTFDVHTGRATWPEGEGCRLFRYPVKVDEDEIRVKMR